MNKHVRKITFLLAVLIVLNLISSVSCTTKSNIKDTDIAKGSNDNIEELEERVKLRLFMSDSGVGIPDVVDVGNNEFINYLKDYANVDLDVEVPLGADYYTKVNLMLSSGDIPDVLHNFSWDDTQEAAMEGAFLEITPYYNSSPIIQKVITKQMMEFNEAKDGKNYCIPMAWTSPAGSGNIVRVDFIDKYYNGKMPETVEEWVDFLRTLKDAIGPTCIPLTSFASDYSIFLWGQTFWHFYGINNLLGQRVTENEMISCFILPEFREALALWRQLYKEGILDQEFAVNTSEKSRERVHNNHLAMWTDGADQLIAQANVYAQQSKDPDFSLALIPPLKQYPEVLEKPE